MLCTASECVIFSKTLLRSACTKIYVLHELPLRGKQRLVPGAPRTAGCRKPRETGGFITLRSYYLAKPRGNKLEVMLEHC